MPEKAQAKEITGYLAAANGYRTAQEKGHRRIVFEAMPFTCGASKGDSLALLHAHERRNDIDYAGESAVSERETDDLVALISDSTNGWKSIVPTCSPEALGRS